MSKVITESEVDFGPFQEDDLFHIEESQLYQSLGAGLKTVEFIFLRNEGKNIVLLEAKKTCPNEENKEESEEKRIKYEEYFADITQKVEDSVNVFIAAILGRYPDKEELGRNFYDKVHMRFAKLTFALVITSPEAEEAWMMGPKAELERRLLRLRKIWKLNIVVINRTTAQKRGLICV